VSDGYFLNFDKMAYVTGEKPSGCVLCLLRDGIGAFPNLTILRSALFIASVNLYPYNPGHLIVYPARHILDIRELSRGEEEQLSELQRYLLGLLDDCYSPKGYNIGYNMGGPAGASIEHLHLHIIPRFPRELGIADLLAGKRVLVEDPRETVSRLLERVSQTPFSSSRS
jgi:ATP adenylyltransferase